MTDETPRNILETFIAATESRAPEVMISHPGSGDITTPLITALPDGMRVHDFSDKWRAAEEALQPFRRKGTAVLQDLDSFIAWANRFKGETSAIFAEIASGGTPGLLCISDYLGHGAPVIDAESRDPTASHCLHKARYGFPISDEWKIWNGISGKPLSKNEFGEFIEANAKDLLDPTPALLDRKGSSQKVEPWEARMIEVAAQLQGRFGQYAALVQLSREFQVNETSNLSVSTNRDTGEQSIQFVDQHAAPDGQPIRIPNLFMIAIPVLDRGALYRLPVRFRYRKSGADIRFIIQIHNPDIALRDALDEAIARAGAETGLPVFFGKPEA
ncbi:DUF2303 family protein [Halodurantibacterium flavum]|uniref:DUF2303 family protein n=1 Tax=Halodurantibacterium flavum TaxID=1382802 RepID=A0ABW4S8B0_9RHOB